MTRPSETDIQVRRMLEELIALHEQMLEAVRDHRGALARADRKAIASATSRQNQLIEKIRRVDAVRREAFGQTLTVSEIAATLPAESRRVVLELAGRLRELIEQVRDEQAVVALASRSLMGHMEGLLRQVAARLNHAGTYGRLGCVEAGAQIVTGIDLTR